MIVKITQITANGRKTKYVGVLLRDGAEFRENSFVLPRNKDAQEHAERIKTALWANGKPATKADWLDAEETGYRDYYLNVLRAIMEQFNSGGSLEMITGMGLNAIAADETKEAEFSSWRMLTELTATQMKDVDDKRDLLALIQNWCLSGLAVGETR